MPNINDKMKPYARALIYVTIHLSRDVHRGSIKKREGERVKFFNRTPTGPRKKSFILYIYIISYKGVVKINTHTVSVLKSNGPFRGEMWFLIKSHWLFMFSVCRYDEGRT